ncbi:MAG: hypothetical protein EOM70_13125, partial [Clostridia bacterium]|nr:hypothetical protein [Clostridia bacterium]
GLEVNFSRIWQQRGDAVKLSLVDLILPILLSFLPIYFLPDHYLQDPSQKVLFALFISAIMTISALPVAIRGMRDLNILKTDLGFLILSALTINDIAGWVIFTIILGLFSYGSFEWAFVLRLVGFTLAFTIISLTLLRRLVDRAVTFIHTRIGEATGLKITFIMLVGAIFGAVTLKIGIHSLFGFFIAGTILGEATHISEKDRFVVNRLVYSIFVPIFFASIGLHLDFIANFDWFLVLLISVLGIISRYVAAYIGGRWSKQDRSNLNIIAINHTPGGQMHIVVGMLAYSSGLISEKILVSIIASAILSTIVFGPWLSQAVRKIRKALYSIVFSEDDVFIDTPATSQDELLLVMSQKVADRTDMDEEMIYHEIKLREEQMSTAMGRGIAIPHVRNPVVLHVTKPTVTLCFLERAIDFHAIDGQPVNVLFTIISPSVRTHLHLLSRLSYVLRTPEIKTTLRQQTSRDELVKLIMEAEAAIPEQR